MATTRWSTAAGSDELLGEGGNDLLIATQLCEGDRLDGGEGRDNASWAKLGRCPPASASTPASTRGSPGKSVPKTRSNARPASRPTTLVGIEDLEGSPRSDVLYGDAGPNQLLGHTGEDTYYAGAGEDQILANSGSRDAVIDCGADFDSAIVDLPAVGDPDPDRMRAGQRRRAGRIRRTTRTPAPVPPVSVAAGPVAPTPAKPKPDRTPPQTKLLRRPPALLRVAPRHRAVATFRFAASERSHFECKLDAKPFHACRSPYRARLAPGRHTFRVYAVDAAGNRDRTPAVVHLRVVARRAGR